ncbi:MAG: nucleotide 5'-monophosphate nucleosidase PpnN [Pseudomonadales bacterium]|jgi:pyrimidine/purine-5'-nucleotide nucleosidase|nr:nucleotide 5'-monophosphate nucleosidase PpnN [Pseudomonadales bacterium]
MEKIDIEVSPKGNLELLSQREVTALTHGAQHDTLQDLFRRCSLAVLNTGNESDDAAAILDAYQDFSIEVTQRTRGLQLHIVNGPSTALVDGRMVEGIRQHLFAVLRDIVHLGSEIFDANRYDLSSSEGITSAVFQMLKHARVMAPGNRPNLVVCWGGHAISREEYDYTKEVGYQLGLRGLDICTGCGPGAMKGPMKGAAVGHAKQRVDVSRFIGLSEPGIIAAEPPNPMVNHLVVLPDIEKRLEAFVRLGHGIIVFPGGVGTAEEILYLMGVLLDKRNLDLQLPVIFTGPASAADYFREIDAFLRLLFGKDVEGKYEIITGDSGAVGELMSRALDRVRRDRQRSGDAYYFNWLMQIPEEHQQPFVATHERVADLRLCSTDDPGALAVGVRRAFSAIVSGNVKDAGIRAIRKLGPFKLQADGVLIDALDRLLQQFVVQGRMKLNGEYEPCYEVTPLDPS